MRLNVKWRWDLYGKLITDARLSFDPDARGRVPTVRSSSPVLFKYSRDYCDGNWDCGASQSNFQYPLGNQPSSQSISNLGNRPFFASRLRRQENVHQSPVHTLHRLTQGDIIHNTNNTRIIFSTVLYIIQPAGQNNTGIIQTLSVSLYFLLYATVHVRLTYGT